MILNSILVDRLIISSELKNLVHVESLIDKVCESKSISEDIYGNILIAVTEAVNNAIIHGNCFNNSLNVELLVHDDSNKLIFTIIDQGNGFDFTSLPDPTAPENIEKENGRGIFLIKNLVDEFVFDLPGNVIHLSFNYD
jgi:serine/threonine-protein kinase RsbW